MKKHTNLIVAAIFPAAMTLSTAQEIASAQDREPLRSLAEKIRERGHDSNIAQNVAVFFGLAPADKPVLIPAKYKAIRKSGVVHYILVTEKLNVILRTQAGEDPNYVVTAYVTDVSGKLYKAGRAESVEIASEIPLKDAMKHFDAEVAFWGTRLAAGKLEKQ